jgi:choline dehydrogenase-like flavoprotein
VLMGADPATSTVDRNCRAHELNNLYVVDASCFPSASACNPVLTIVANSLRVADHIKARL